MTLLICYLMVFQCSLQTVKTNRQSSSPIKWRYKCHNRWRDIVLWNIPNYSKVETACLSASPVDTDAGCSATLQCRPLGVACILTYLCRLNFMPRHFSHYIHDLAISKSQHGLASGVIYLARHVVGCQDIVACAQYHAIPDAVHARNGHRVIMVSSSPNVRENCEVLLETNSHRPNTVNGKSFNQFRTQRFAVTVCVELERWCPE